MFLVMDFPYNSTGWRLSHFIIMTSHLCWKLSSTVHVDEALDFPTDPRTLHWCIKFSLHCVVTGLWVAVGRVNGDGQLKDAVCGPIPNTMVISPPLRCSPTGDFHVTFTPCACTRGNNYRVQGNPLLGVDALAHSCKPHPSISRGVVFETN